jgi:hypothetical protein
MCQHGHEGYCYDEATHEQREAFDMLHRHAYEWALPAGRDEAEAYAAAYAAENYAYGIEEATRHSQELYDRLTA